ncbi:MAG: C69 family dipeptidase [Bacteroidetes bacterium]|nr:C69 family dipeptidase [Bacteroidota bacterium]
MKKFRFIALLGILIYTSGVFYYAQACTNFLVSKGASKDGSCFITYAADSHTLYGELYYRPAKDYAAGSMMDIYEWDTGKPMGKIKQVLHTYSVIGNMNEYQVAVGETTYTGREELQDTTAVIDYGSMMYLALQRSKTAREAIKVMAELVAEYGYYSTGESISVSDPNEVWIFEIIGKGSPVYDKTGKIDPKLYSKGAVWVARRIPDGYISGHANHARITTFPLEDGKISISSKNLAKIFNPTVETVYAYDVITFARQKKYFTGKDAEFDFSGTYAPLDFSGARFSEARVWAGFYKVCKEMESYTDYALGENLKHRMPLWVKPDHKLSVQDVMSMMRDHYEGTPLDMTKDLGGGPYESGYRWRPLTWKVNGVDYLNERAISTQQTGFSFIAQSRSWLPNPVGGIFWFGVDDSYSTVYTPMYCGITKAPYNFAEGNGSMLKYSPTSAFWVFNQVSNFCYTRYNVIIKDIQKVQSELENKFFESTPNIDKKAEELYKTDKTAALNFITEYSSQQGSLTFNKWKELYEYILVKYIDGNIKKEKDGKFQYNGYTQPAYPSQPGYPEWYLKKIVDQTGDKLKVKGEIHH